jgi:hypothetical protein
MMANTKRGIGTALLAASLMMPVACDDGVQPPTDSPAQSEGGKADEADAVTDGLSMLAHVEDEEQLEALFEASVVDRGDTMDKVISLLDEQDVNAVKIKGEGVPLFTDFSFFRLGAELSQMARIFWTGKVFTFQRDAEGEITASLENDLLIGEHIRAQVTIESLAEAMVGRGEEAPRNGELPTFGFDEEPVGVDGDLSVILNYAGTEVRIFDSLIDEIRPVSHESLEAAGIEVPDGTEVEHLWIGRATARFGLFHRTRKFALYFALDFDPDSVEPLAEAPPEPEPEDDSEEEECNLFLDPEC